MEQLSFEILDTVFSFFSTSDSDRSYFDNQADLLSFTQVSKQFNAVARLHLPRFIHIGSTSKAKQLLSLFDDDPTFATRVQSLLLVWPDQAKYKTRRTTIITYDDVVGLLSACTALRQLELVCLPYFAFSDLDFATLRSLDALSNLRSLSFGNSSWVNRKQEFSVIAQMLSQTPNLKSLHLRNMPLDLPETVDLPLPAYSLSDFSILVASPRAVRPHTLQWMLGKSSTMGTIRRLTVHLAIDITEEEEFDGPVDRSFSGIEEALASVAPSATHISLLGLRQGQTAAILSKATSSLGELELYADCEHWDTLLSEFPTPSGLKTLTFPLLPSLYGGVRLMETTAESKKHLPQRRRQKALIPPGKSPAAATQDGSADPAAASTSTAVEAEPAEIVDSRDIYHPELPFPSAAFLAELGPGGKLENLQRLVLPDNARFMRRGRWLNNTVLKACRKHGIEVEETPVGLLLS